MFNELPKTFQDAVTINRKLGIRHIWIDSLCIIQDDDEDWRMESSKMASIYQNGFLTIAASRASGDNDGCFSVGAEKYMSRQIKFDDLNGSEYILHTRPVLPHDDNRSPLFHRAWFFQQWLLSPRVIQYTDSELVWECTEMKQCECSPKVTKPSLSRSAKVSLAQGLRLGSPPDSINTGGLPIQATWRIMVAMYSSSRLTYAKDIFPALSGAARVMQQQRKTRYVAGLWEDSLAEDLMWKPGSELIDKPGNWRAPTWSWASLGGPVNYAFWNSSTKKDAQIIDISCVPVGSDPLGELVSGHIDISGRILLGALACDDGSDIEFKDGGKCQFRRDKSAAWYAQHDCSSLTPGTPVHLLLISSVPKDASPRRYFSLVLRCVDKKYQVYERIGIKTAARFKDVQLFSKLLEGIKPRRIRIV